MNICNPVVPHVAAAIWPWPTCLFSDVIYSFTSFTHICFWTFIL